MGASTVEALWSSFLADIANDLTDDDREVMKLAFFAGVASVLVNAGQLGEDVDPVQLAGIMGSQLAEASAFLDAYDAQAKAEGSP